jgi:hypothetical protein
MDEDDRDCGDLPRPQSGERGRQSVCWANRDPRLWSASAPDGGTSRVIQRISGPHAVAASG